MISHGDRVLLTGISGFVAKHIALRLLNEGYRVRGTVRGSDKADCVRSTLERQGADVSKLEFVTADLLADDGWSDALDGIRFVLHTASPFPARAPGDRMGLVPAARGGTLRVIDAARLAGVERVVLTSSVAAVYYGHEARQDQRFTEADWSVPESPSVSPYSLSKTLAERAAWDAVAGTALQLATVNPSLVLGPLLDVQTGTSVRLVAMLMKGLLPIVPDASFGVVDVRDVAEAHVAALVHHSAEGRRFILSAGSIGLMEIAAAITAALPDYRRRMPKAVLPDGFVRWAARLVPPLRPLVPELGRRKELVCEPAESILGIRMRPPQEAVAATARSLREFGLA